MSNNSRQQRSGNVSLQNTYNVSNERWSSFTNEQKEFYNDLRTKRDDIVQRMNIPTDCLSNVNKALDEFILETATTLDRYIPEHS